MDAICSNAASAAGSAPPPRRDVPLQQRAAQHEVRLADLVEEVVAPLRSAKRLACMLVGRVVVAGVADAPPRMPRACAASGCEPASTASANDAVRCSIACSGWPSRSCRPPRFSIRRPSVPLVVQLLVDRPRLLCVLAGEHPVPHLLRHEDAWKYVPRRPVGRPSPGRARRLARRPPARPRSRPGGVGSASATRGSARAGVARQPGSLGERERLVEEADRGRDARDPVAAAAGAEEHVGPVEVGELRLDPAPAPPAAPRAPRVARPLLGAQPLARTRAARLGGCERRDLLARLAEGVDGLLVAVGFLERLSARASFASTRLRTSAETPWARRRVHPEPLGEPGDGLGGRSVFPRSIWLTYSFESARRPARSGSGQRRRAASGRGRRRSDRAHG